MEQAKREIILDAAVKAFAQYGFKKTSVDEIARDAGVAKGTVYLACESKEDLFYQALHREVRNWCGESSKLIDPRKPADEILIAVSRASFASMAQRPLVRDLFLGIVNGVLPGWMDRFADLRALGNANIEEILRLGIKQGIFRKNLNIPEVADLLQDLQIVSLLNLTHTGDSSALERRAEAGFDLVLHGIRARG
jgi:AcrR family transcriptional regulator